MNKALLDTDMFSEVTKGVNSNVVLNATAYRATFGKYTLSVITVMEIVRGFQRRQSQRRLRAFLGSLTNEEIFLFDRDAAELAGQISGELDRVGRPIGSEDPMIAAIALRNGLELITGNTAHYQRIQQIGYPLILHDWRA